MWAIELWEPNPNQGSIPGTMVLGVARAQRVTCYANGDIIVRTRGDCAHHLMLRERDFEACDCGEHVLLYCYLCERSVEAHVSEIPGAMRPLIASRVDDLVWAAAAN